MTFTATTPVPYYQVDQQGVVFNMWYLAWFDDAMTSFLEHIGYPYPVMTAAGLDAQLVHIETDWVAGVRFGSDVGVEVCVDRVGTTSFALAFTVRTQAGVHASARSVYVLIAADGSGKVALPDELRSALS